MRSYVVIQGDTFSIIARKQYGIETESGLIAKANPGVFEPLAPGIRLVIPDRPDALPTVLPNAPAVSEDEVALSIDKKRFRFWDSVSITRSMDTLDTVEFVAPLEFDNTGFRDAFVPFSYADILITVGGAPLFTGVMLAPVPDLDAIRKTVAVSGYSLPGAMNDCPIPASAFPLEFNGQGLQDIAKTVARYFGVAVEFEDQQGPIFERVAADPTRRAFDFLTELAQQRNFVISSTPEGKLLFQRSVSPGSPVARLAQGEPPLVAVTTQFNPQGYYSHVTGLAPAVVGVDGSQHTVENSRLKGVIRPFTFKADDTKNADVKEAVEAKMGRMFANTVSYPITVSTWRDPQGKLWAPNTTITLLAKGAMIYSDYEFIIRSVEFSRDEASESAVLRLVLPGAFDGKIPEVMPWEM